MKTAIVTGASSGMGRDFARILDTYSLDEIWVVARREERLIELEHELKTKVRVFPMDITKEESISSLKECLVSEKADVKYLVNAAGFGIFGEFSENHSTQSDMVTLNSKALVDVTYAVLPFMKEGSNIINLGSNSSWQPVPYMAVYGATKAFVLSFSRALAMEVKRKGIKVIAVCPGWIRTEFFDRAVHDDTIVYYDRFYESMDVVKKAMKDLEKGKLVSILGFPVRMQVRLVKMLPVKFVMKTWLRQQKKPL